MSRLRRREFLRRSGGALAAAFAVPHLHGCVGELPEEEWIEDPGFLGGPERLPASNWLHGAAIGGVELYREMNGPELEAALDRAAADGLTVAELDSELSFFMTDAEFEEQIVLLDQAARSAHRRGIRAVAYYPTLEVLTPNADVEGTPTMAGEHPEWLQIDLRGQKSVFIGGDGRVFWVEEGMESAWMCPLTPYTDLYLARVARLAGTALDGLWPDVPLLSDIAAEWPCTNEACRQRFLADTGLELRPEAWPDFDDPAFRRWVGWRHDIVREFEQRVLSTCKAVREDFEVIVETVTMDYSGATVQGLDAASGDDGGLYRVWEVDAVSDETGMREASARDWLSMAIMMKHGRGCAGPLPSWTFCYGKQADDAEHVLGLAVVTNNAPFEARIPDMLTSVGTSFRQRAFEWLGRIRPLFEAPSRARVAVLYCPASRDFLDRNAGVGLYSDLNLADDLWWSDHDPDRAIHLPYLADYRGTCALLMHEGEPFEVLTPPHIARLAALDVLLLPSPSAVPEDTVVAIDAWVRAGGTLITTGGDLARYDEAGAERAAPLLAQRLGVTPVHEWHETPAGSGRVISTSQRAGGDYYRGDPAPRGVIAGYVTAHRPPVLTLGAPDAVLADLRRAGGRTWLVLANLDGIGEATAPADRFAPKPAEVTALVYDPALTAGTLHVPGSPPEAATVVRLDEGLRVHLTVHTTAVLELS